MTMEDNGLAKELLKPPPQYKREEARSLQVDSVLRELFDAMLDFKLGRTSREGKSIEEAMDSFFQADIAIEESLRKDEDFLKTVSKLNSIMEQAEYCLEGGCLFPKYDFFFFRFLVLYRNNINVIESKIEKIDIHDLKRDGLRIECFKAVAFLVKYGEKREKEMAGEVLSRQRDVLVTEVKRASKLGDWGPILTSFIEKSDRLGKGQEGLVDQILSKVIEDDFSDDKRGEKTVSLTEYIFKRNLKGEERKIVEKVLERYDFDSRETEMMIKAWEESAPRYRRLTPPWEQGFTLNEAVKLNLEAIIAIENQRPGITKFLLKNFGIRCFGRYPTDLLIRQYEDFTDQKPYGVVLFPRRDNSPKKEEGGAFYGEEKWLASLLEQLDGNYNLRVVEAGSKFEVARGLINFKKRYQPKISFAIIGGHGTEDSIQLGSSYFDTDLLKTGDLKGHGVKRTSEFFEENPTIILDSCSTGTDEGIGKKLSEMMGAIVIAPKFPTRIVSIKVTEKEGRLYFEVRFREKEALRVFKREKK